MPSIIISMLGVYVGAALAFLSLLLLRRDDKAISELRDQRSLVEKEQDKLRTRRLQENSSKYNLAPPPQTFSDKFLQTLKTDEDTENLGYLKIFIEYFESATAPAQTPPPAQINQNPLWNSVKWIKRLMYAALVLVLVSVGLYGLSLVHSEADVVGRVRRWLVTVYPKLDGET